MITNDRDLTPEELENLRALTRNAVRRVRWPFSTMHVGAMVTVMPELVDRARNAVNQYAWRTGKQFITRLQPDGSVKIARLA